MDAEHEPVRVDVGGHHPDRERSRPEPQRMAEVGDPGVSPDQVEGERSDREEDRLGEQAQVVRAEDLRHQHDEPEEGQGTPQHKQARPCHERRSASPCGRKRRMITAVLITTAFAQTAFS